MSRHVLYFPDLPQTGCLSISGEEARHAARVKRLQPGDSLSLHDGRGGAATARILDLAKDRRGEWTLSLELLEHARTPRTTPRVRLCTGVPKGERLAELIDSISQAGAACWSPLASARAIVDPREGKIERLHRVTIESLKQSGRAWLLEIGPAVSFAQAIALPNAVLADASGPLYAATGASEVTLLIGPEGGFDAAEIALARERGAAVSSFGVHTMRTETAATVAAAIILDAERRTPR